MSYLVANPEDRFSRDEAHLSFLTVGGSTMKLCSRNADRKQVVL